MNHHTHTLHPVQDEEDVGAARRAVGAAAEAVPGLVPGDAELVATELATNILRHSRGGYLLHRAHATGIELIAVDHGDPGRPAPWPTLFGERGFQTAVAAGLTGPQPCSGVPGAAAGLGVGLAAVARRATTLDWYATRAGAVVLADLRPAVPTTAGRSQPVTRAPQWRWGAVDVPYAGEQESGDAWAVTEAGERIALLVVDGLGHGPEAARAARAALVAFAGASPAHLTTERLPDVVNELHHAMLGTRGGVLGLTLIDRAARRAAFTGVGNITGRIVAGSTTRQLIGHPGMLGTHMRPPKPRVDVQPWNPGNRLIMTTDGIRTRGDTGPYAGLLDHHPTVAAATLHRDLTRGTDDATVLVVQDLRSPHPADPAT